MESLWGFGIALVLVIGWDWYRKRGKRAAEAKDKELIDQLEGFGFKREK